jgi:hypothetical protein
MKYSSGREVDDQYRHVTYADPLGNRHVALVTNVWSTDEDGAPMTVNLVYVEPDPATHDQYGNQLHRDTSVVRRNEHSAHGRWFELI